MHIKRNLILLILILTMIIPCDAFAATTYTVKENDVTVYTASGQRSQAIKQMFKMSEAKWSIKSPITYEYKPGFVATMETGNHRGIPYTQYLRNYPDTDTLQANMTLTASDCEANPVCGLDCSSAITYALRYATGNTSSGNNYLMSSDLPYNTSAFLIDGMRDGEGETMTAKGFKTVYRDNLSKVGYYGKYTGYTKATDSETIVNSLMAYGNYPSGSINENVYACMKPGDLLVKVMKDGTGHVMMITDIKFAYASDGSIDPVATKVYIIDQSKPDRSVYSDGSLGSWRTNNTRSDANGNRNNVFTFSSLASGYFLPITSWKETSSYEISYNLNGGSGSYPAQTKNTYTPVQIPSAAPARKGYDFGGWKSTAGSTDKIYKAGGIYNQDYSITLKAIWNAHSGKIIFDANGGTNAPESVTQYYGKSLTLPKEVPVLRGYAFCGWATSRNAADGQYQAGESFKDYSRLEKGSGASLTLYAVWKKTVAEADISLSETERYYNHLNFRPEVTVNYLGKDLVENKDYTLTYPSESIEEGSYTVKVEGMGEYIGTVKLPYKVIKHEQSISSISSKAKIMGAGSFSLRAKAKTKLTYKTSKSSVAKVSSRGRITLGNVGTATITMTAKSTDYYSKATKKIKISVCPKGTTMTALSSKNNIMTVKWNKQTNQTSGYQIRISTSSSMNDPIIVSVAGNTQTERNMAGFKKGKKYYVQVRTYKSISGQKYCSVWSPMKSVVIK